LRVFCVHDTAAIYPWTVLSLEQGLTTLLF